MATMVYQSFKYASVSAAILLGSYATLLCLLTTPFFQANVVYLHKIRMTWFKDLNVPESFGFLRGQATPFSIKSSSGDALFAWHILPIELYHFSSHLAFKLLRDDPEARLVIHMHGAAGIVGSGYRVRNYRALSAGQPNKIHVLTFDYRGFGHSRGSPSERGLCLDAITVVDWALNVAGIPPPRILIFSQSIGTAVALAVSEHYATQPSPIVFGGTILVAPFVDVATLISTYSIAGTIPLISPLARFPSLFKYLKTFIKEPWSSKDRIAAYVRANEANGKRYRLTLIHAEDDWDIPYTHTQTLFWHAVNATLSESIPYEGLEEIKAKSVIDLGAGGSVVKWRSENGLIREEIPKTGLHDVTMGNPIISLAVMRILTAEDSSLE